MGEGRDGGHSRLAAEGNERTKEHVVLKVRIMEACQGIAGLWQSFKKETWEGAAE